MGNRRMFGVRRMGFSVSAALLLSMAAACSSEGPGGGDWLAEETTSQAEQAMGAWSYTGSMSAGRIVATATALPDGSVLVTGGWLSFANLLSSAERYDPVTGVFSAAGNMQGGRWSHAATLLADGSVLVSGGEINGNVNQTVVDRYDPATGVWSAAAPMNYARRGHVSVRLNDGRVLVATGDSATGDRSAEIYDPVANTWTIASSLVIGRQAAQGTTLTDGRVFVIGGLVGATTTATAETYDPGTNSWTQAAPMAYPRYGHSVTLLNDGRVLVAGGADTDGYYAVPRYAHAEIYNPATNTWSAPVAMNAARETHTATRLLDGRVLLAGGSGLSSTEVFDPATNTFTAESSMNTVRVDHVAAALPDGSVLVAGGLPGSNNNSDIYSMASLSSAERISGAPPNEILGIAAGANHALAIVGTTAAPSAYSWGLSSNGRLGRTGDTTTPIVIPGLVGNVALPLDNGKKTIAAGGNHSLVVLANGQIAAFGADGLGQVGNGLPASGSVTTPAIWSLPSGAHAVAVAAGTQHSLALDDAGVVWAWGANASGQLGDGTTTNQPAPVQVAGLSGAARGIAAGGDHSLVILADGSLRAFGRNDFGQLGAVAAPATSSIPLPVLLPAEAIAAEAGTNHSVVLLANGGVYTWGSDGSGQLGNGPGVTSMSTPGAAVPLPSTAIGIAAGGSHSVVLLSDGTARSFGADASGQLGNDAAFTGKQTVQTVASVSNAFTIAAGTSYSLFAVKNLTLLSAGNDASGQLGNGPALTTNQPTPIAFTLTP